DGTNKFLDADDLARATITQKNLAHDGVTDIWTYDIQEINHATGQVTGPDGSVTIDTAYPTDSGATAFARDGKAGLVYRSNRSHKEMVERHWTMLPFSGANTGPAGMNSGSVSFNPVVDAEYFSLLDGTQNDTPVRMSAKKYQYDYNGNMIQEID